MSDVNIDHIESLVGPLPRRREWERWCEYTQPLSLPERGKADAALAEAYEKIQELDDKLMEAEGAHENARRWFEEQKKQFARAEKATEYARIEVKRKNEAVEREAAAIERAEKAEAEARKWEWVAKHTYVCPLGEMNPGEPGSYVIEVRPSAALLARYEEEHHD